VKKRSDPTQIVREIDDKLSLDEHCGGSLDAMLATPMLQLGEELLAPKGHWSRDGGLHSPLRGASSDFSIFVVIPTRGRVLERHDTLPTTVKYDETRGLVEGALSTAWPFPVVVLSHWIRKRPAVHLPSAMSTTAKSELARTYCEMYGLFVQVGKHYRQKQGLKCEDCPLGSMLKRRGRANTGIMWA
jgi:hypothetical protein